MTLFVFHASYPTDTVRELLEKGVSAKVKINGYNSLHIACKKNHIRIVQEILSHYGEKIVDVRTDDGRTPMHISCFEGNFAIVKVLQNFSVTYGVDVDRSGNTALHMAAWGGHKCIVEYLVESLDISPRVKNYECMEPVHFAAAGNHCDIFEYFISLVSPGEEFESPTTSGLGSLHRAAMVGSIRIMKFILERGLCAQNALAANGSTCLHFACQGGKV